MLRSFRLLPWFRLLAIAKIALTAHRHLRNLTREERRRLVSLTRRARRLTPEERDELRGLAAKLDVRVFTASVVDGLAPWPIRRFARRLAR